MSLFSKLRGLGLEDSHTEIVAQVLRDRRDLAVQWFAELGVTAPEEADNVSVVTQERLVGLEARDPQEDRPDVSIRISRGDSQEIIYLESKIGSREGHSPNRKSQLQRYAEQLANIKGAGVTSRALIYITRDFEPKTPPGDPRSVTFRQVRWYDFYQFLKKIEPDPTGLVRQLILFMEENNMSLRNQFASIDILALTNFRRSQQLMDATMWEGVAEKFRQVCGGVSSRKKATSQLVDDDRYYMSVKHGQGDQLYILLGYVLEEEGRVIDYPKPFVTIEVSPKAAARAEIVKAMREFLKLKDGTWRPLGLEAERKWSAIISAESLQNFLAEGDHVKRVAAYFMKQLDDVAEFRKRYPKLPWSAQPTDDSED